MNTIQFFTALLNWLLADPVHLSFAAGLIAACTPTPSPDSLGGKAYKAIDILALNFLHAKETGHVLDPQVAAQVAALLGEKFRSQEQPSVLTNATQEQSK